MGRISSGTYEVKDIEAPGAEPDKESRSEHGGPYADKGESPEGDEEGRRCKKKPGPGAEAFDDKAPQKESRHGTGKVKGYRDGDAGGALAVGVPEGRKEGAVEGLAEADAGH